MDRLLSCFLYAAPLAAAVMLSTAVYCLLPGRTACGERSRRLLMLTLGLLAAALVLRLAGSWVLAACGLAWRGWVCSLLGLACLLLAGVGIFQTLDCWLAPGCVHRLPTQILVGISALTLLGVLVTLGLPGWFLSHCPERVLDWEGQTLVQVDHGFLDPDYSYYMYCGPLVRGSEPVEAGETPPVFQ